MSLYLLIYAGCLCLLLNLDKELSLPGNHSWDMSEPSSEYQRQLDPKAPLSTKDLAILLIDRCNNKSEENKNRIEDERGHTDNQVKAVISGFGKELSKVIEDVNRNTSDQAVRIADLELKLETVVSYCEQLLYTHQHDAHNLILAENLAKHVQATHGK